MSSVRSPGRARWALTVIAVLAVVNAVSSAGGALGLATGFLDLGNELSARLPWSSPIVGGVALAILVTVPNSLLSVLALRRDRHAPMTAIVVGAAMVVWIAVELAYLREVSFFHPLFVVVGVVMMAAGARLMRVELGVGPRTLAAELRDVAVDLPRFLSAPLMRRRQLRWGATDSEVATALPGDEQIPHPDYLATRAVTIDAPPDQVWPWLVQVGHGRAGFYSDDLLDNDALPSAEVIRPDLQRLELGQWVPMAEHVDDRTAFRVAAFQTPYMLLWAKPDSTWSWRLTETESGGTRLVTRVRATYDWHHPLAALGSLLLLELGDFAMQRRMLMHLRERAESVNAQARPPAPGSPSELMRSSCRRVT